MDNLIKLDASAVSHMGSINETNENNFYMDGRFLYDHGMDNVQVTIDNSGSEYVFAVSNGMDMEMPDKNSSISAVMELKKFHEKMKNVDKEFEYKFEELCECVEEANNIIYSVLLGDDEERGKKTAFAGLVMNGNKAAVLNIGECRVCLYRGGMLKQLSADYKKAERLLKMGIITDEQAEVLSDRFGVPADGKRIEVKKSDIFNLRAGDVFLLCSSGLSRWVDDEQLVEIISLRKDSDYIANMLRKEALSNGAKDDVTAMVVKVESVDGEEEIKAPPRKTVNRYSNLHISQNKLRPSKQMSRRRKMIKKYASMAVTLAVVVGVIFGIIKLWDFLSNNSNIEEAVKQNEEEQTDIFSEEDYTDESSTGDETEPVDDPEAVGEEEPPVVEETTQQVTHQVQEGDSLYQISRKYYNDPQKYKLIMEANDIEDPDIIKVGQILIIPEISEE